MSGQQKVVAKIIKDKAHFGPYVHCHAHRLNLAPVQSAADFLYYCQSSVKSNRMYAPSYAYPPCPRACPALPPPLKEISRDAHDERHVKTQANTCMT